jgi:hypothetical protein
LTRVRIFARVKSVVGWGSRGREGCPLGGRRRTLELFWTKWSVAAIEQDGTGHAWRAAGVKWARQSE